MAQSGARWHLLGDFWAISLGPQATRNGAHLGAAEPRSLQRKPLPCQALCRWIPFVSRQSPAWDRGCRITPLTVPPTRRMCVPAPGTGSGSRFRDLKSIRRRRFVLTTSPRWGEVGRRPGEGNRCGRLPAPSLRSDIRRKSSPNRRPAFGRVISGTHRHRSPHSRCVGPNSLQRAGGL
jgi:hypothetical protein